MNIVFLLISQSTFTNLLKINKNKTFLLTKIKNYDIIKKYYGQFGLKIGLLLSG